MRDKNLIDAIWDKRQDKPISVDMQSLWQEIKDLKLLYGKPFPRGYQVLKLLYNSDGSPSGLTLDQVGKIIGVSGNRVFQNKEKSFAMLRNPQRRVKYEKKNKWQILMR